MHANPPTWHWYIIHYPTQWSFFQEQFVLLQTYQMGFFFLMKNLKDFPYLFLLKNSPSLWPQPTPGDYDLIKHECALPLDGSTQV